MQCVQVRAYIYVGCTCIEELDVLGSGRRESGHIAEKHGMSDRAQSFGL